MPAKYKTKEQQISAFMSRVKIDQETGCWNWQGEIRWGDKYGECWSFGRRERAHQAAYREIKCGVLLDGQVLRHTCDNRACCNPDHIIPGTQADNMRDKVERNRQAKGERHGCAKLCAEQVLAIRSSPLSQRKLARVYGVSQPHIGLIKRREIWTHLG